MALIYHIVASRDLDSLFADGDYSSTSLNEEGFIHFSQVEQVAASLKKHFSGQKGLKVIEVDEALLRSEVRYESVADRGQSFPHVYGPVNREAICRILEDKDPLFA